MSFAKKHLTGKGEKKDPAWPKQIQPPLWGPCPCGIAQSVILPRPAVKFCMLGEWAHRWSAVGRNLDTKHTTDKPQTTARKKKVGVGINWQANRQWEAPVLSIFLVLLLAHWRSKVGRF